MKKFNIITCQNALVKSCVVPVGAVYGTIKVPHTIVRNKVYTTENPNCYYKYKIKHKEHVTLEIDYVLTGFKSVNGYYFPICKLCYGKKDAQDRYIWSKPTILWGKYETVRKQLGIHVSMLCKEHGINPKKYAPDFNIVTNADILAVSPHIKKNKPINDCRYYNPVPKNQDMQVCTLGLDNTFRSLPDRSK